MIKTYEERVLGGVTLESVCTEYEGVKRDPMEYFLKLNKYFLLYTFLVTMGVAILIERFDLRYIALVIEGIFIVLLIIYFKLCTRKTLNKDREIIHRFEHISDDFMSCVDSLNPIGITIPFHSEASVRDMLVTLAVRILDCEASFDEVRKQDWRDVFGILHLGNFLHSCHADFVKVSNCAKDKFGIEFKKAEIFADAQKHIEAKDKKIKVVLKPVAE